MLSQIYFVFVVVQLCATRNVIHKPPHVRIIGGNEAIPNSAPYMVYVELHDPAKPESSGRCGGSLITPEHVLTAAHCLDSPKTIKYVIVGAHDISKEELNQQKHYVADYKIHNKDKNQKYAHDIAVIKLKTSVTLNDFVKLVKLPTTHDTSKTYVGEIATAYGWGLTHNEPIRVKPNVLMTVDLKVISNEDCLKKASKKYVYSGDLCTDGTGTKGVCHGDSGGPLMISGVQIGVISRGTTNYCEKSDPNVYVKVASYLEWIEEAKKGLK